MENTLHAWHQHASAVLDVRPDLARGDEPFVRIMETAETIQSGQTFLLIAPFEPVPLYNVLGERGFTHVTEKVDSDEWIVQFERQ